MSTSNSLAKHAVRPASTFLKRVATDGKLARKILACVYATVVVSGALAQANNFTQTNIVSDGFVPAAQTDPTLVNPWGVAIGKAFWIDSPGSGMSLVDDAKGVKSLSVPVPPAAMTSTHGTPSGIVFNNDPAVFTIPGSTSALFLFATLDGTIAGWNASEASAVTLVNNASAKASYTGIAINKSADGTTLLAANLAQGSVDVFSSSFAPVKLAGAFADPQLPAGFNPFNIQVIAGQVYVTYSQFNAATGKRVAGAGLGVVNIFDQSGNFVKRAITAGALNEPWGMAVAPAGFGPFGGNLLVANFGDGTINAFDRHSFAMTGTLQDAKGAPVVNSGIWEILFGGKNNVGDPNTLYFSAGVNGAKDGLFGSLALTPEPAGTPDFTISGTPSTLTVAAGSTGTVPLSLTGANSFSGPISFACSGLPTGASCAFSPSTVTLSGTAASTVNVTIATTTAASGYAHLRGFDSRSSMALAMGLLSPFGLFAFAGVRRRSAMLRGAVLMGLLTAAAFTTTGCGSTQAKSVAPVQAPTTSQVTISATSGATTHTVVVALTVK